MSGFLRFSRFLTVRRKVNSSKPLLVWLLLLAFGIPALGGDGLHLLLHFGSEEHSGSHRGECPAQKDGSPETGEFWTAAGDHHVHDGSHCFLCQFLSDCHPFAASAPTLTAIENVRALFVGRDSLLLLNRLFYPSGRSPPQK